jgi:hypothetical protein
MSSGHERGRRGGGSVHGCEVNERHADNIPVNATMMVLRVYKEGYKD